MKYFITIVALCLRTAYSLNKGLGWEILALVFSVAAAIVGTYWDLVYDWGLLQRHSRNRWLRDRLLVPRKSVYFGAMVSLKNELETSSLLSVIRLTRFIDWNAGPECSAEICMVANSVQFQDI